MWYNYNSLKIYIHRTGGLNMDEEIKTVNETEEAAEPETAPAEAEEAEEAVVESEAADDAEETIGNIKISVEVVSTIAGIAASEIEGVSCMYTSFVDGVAQRLGAKKSASKGVRVDMTGSSVIIDLYIVVEYGVKIPELAWEIQENVKNSVETMTGMAVEKVNIHIEGISFGGAAADTSAEEITD